ncbi:MAG: GNAT family N-acetyltransferase [Phycisphaeraceae bacterium]|nr:GNAT family N-acetyltransferase [Phycisphaeraceae bacterium]
MSVAYAAPAGPEDLPQIASIISQAFAGGTSEQTIEWATGQRLDDFRVLRRADRIEACLLLIPMGTFLGGQSVPTEGIAGVGVLPECRGRGRASLLMRQTILELAERGVAVSSLYSAWQPLYRSVGFEQAGLRMEYTISMRALRLRREFDRAGSDLEVRRADDADVPAIRGAYRSGAAGQNGWLDRGDYIWGRIPAHRGETRQCFVVVDAGRIAGYVYLAQRRNSTGMHDIFIADWMAHGLESWCALLRFVRGYASMGDKLIWYGGATHPAMLVLDEQRSIEGELSHWWMLRVVDAGAALRARGYSLGATGEVHLRIADPLIAPKERRLVLRVNDGRGVVEPGGRGDVEVGVAALAPLLTGFVSAQSLAALGQIRGASADVGVLGGLFAAETPATPDFF